MFQLQIIIGNIQLWEGHGGANQRWTMDAESRLVVESPNGYVLIPDSLSDGAKLKVVNGNQGPIQQWQIQKLY